MTETDFIVVIQHAFVPIALNIRIDIGDVCVAIFQYNVLRTFIFLTVDGN
jgi:hypothetical protein